MTQLKLQMSVAKLNALNAAMPAASMDDQTTTAPKTQQR
jgi:hypothetical protein